MASKTLALAPQPVLQYVADLEEAGAMDAVSLSLTDPDLPYERWESLGRFLGRIDRASRWWIGDWLNFGEALYGEESAQAVEATNAERYDEAERITGLDHGTLMNIRSICGRISKSRRQSALGFWVHEPVAALEPDDQKKWLDRCIQEGWTKNQLRSAIRGEPIDDANASVSVGGEPGLTLGERVEAAARLVFHQGQPTRTGDVLVPGEAWQHLVSALGEE